MSRVRDLLKKDVQSIFGECASGVVDYLFDRGTLDDCIARQHVALDMFREQYGMDSRSARQVAGDVGEDLGMTRERVGQIVRRGLGK